MSNHIQVIHVLKSKLRMSDDDYRVLLADLTRTANAPGKTSSKQMNGVEQQRVRDHLQGLVDRLPGATPRAARQRTRAQFEQIKKAASPKERKVWAMWNQLGRDGQVRDTGEKALNAWVDRTVHVTALRFATGPQLDTLIEALKAWQNRGAEHG